MTDVTQHEKIRVVIRGIGIDETAVFNNEFEVYLGGTPAPEPTPTPKPVPPTGDRTDPGLWLILLGVGLAMMIALLLLGRRRLHRD